MLGKLGGREDTIVALATPPGVGAIGVVRLSGPQAVSIADAAFPSRRLAEQPSHTLHVGLLKEEGRVVDEVVIALFRAPRSYTGEDVVEISGHGSPYVLEQIIRLCIGLGARLAQPGEFTQRAFLNGKLDLTQAEAVADLIASNSAASHRTSLYNIRGGFSAKLKILREQLIGFSALIELELDFSQEDVEFADRSRLHELIEGAEKMVQELVESFRMGNVIKQGVSTAIIGKPNAGKSTLLNALLNENRAIVSEIAGTTRDTIEEVLNMEGILFRLIDTAGIREHTTDAIETIGVERSLEKMRKADVVLYLFDTQSEIPEEVLRQRTLLEELQLKYLLIGNKADLQEDKAVRDKYKEIPDILFISAKEGAGLPRLKERLAAVVLEGNLAVEDTVVTNARHHAALQEVLASLKEVRRALDEKLPGDLMALDIRRCLYYIGEITGEITNEDRLDYIFSKFCIGK